MEDPYIWNIEVCNRSEVRGWIVSSSSSKDRIIIGIKSRDGFREIYLVDEPREDVAALYGSVVSGFHIKFLYEYKDEVLVYAKYAETQMDWVKLTDLVFVDSPVGRIEKVYEGRFTGWATVPGNESIECTVELIRDGEMLSLSRTTVERPDVQKIYNGSLKCGFELYIPWSTLVKPRHNLNVKAIGDNGREAIILENLLPIQPEKFEETFTFNIEALDWSRQ